MSSWLICSTEPGMFPDESAVQARTAAGHIISLFAPNDKIMHEGNHDYVKVDVLDRDREAALVFLPSPALENSSRTIFVPQNAIVSK